MSGPAFSRLQLAAALIEYDNDPANPDAPYRSAQDSAIFLSARRTTARTQQQSVADAWSETRSVVNDASHSGAGLPQGELDDEPEDHDSEPEVDLASWGLDTFIKPEKKPKKSAAKLAEARAAVARAGDQTHQRSLSIPLPVHADADTIHSSALRTTRLRSSTLNDRDGIPAAPQDSRRMSYASPLDLVGVQADDSLKARPVSMFAAMDVHDPLARSGTPASLSGRPFPADAGENDSPFAVPLSSPTSRFDPKFAAAHGRTMSNATLGSRPSDNPFAVPLPAAGQASRFDPKVAHARTTSNATMMSRLQADNSPYAVPPEQGDRPDSTSVMDEPYGLPSGARTSTYGPSGARQRTASMASMGSRMMLDPDALEPPRPTMPERGSWRYSKMDLMRPKVLVMPVPLSEQDNPPEEPRRDGFLVSTDGPPLPPAARTRPISSRFPSSSGSNGGLTFNPRQSLTLSQLTFRNTLLVDGQRDVAYVDVDDALPRAQEDGQQAEISLPEEIDEFGKLAPAESRAPGSLYGRSLIDDLEQRKAQMKGKQRVFTGDDRPSMMHRGGRRTTFIDPEFLQQRPVSGPVLDRPAAGGRISSAPLLDSNERPVSGVPNTKSVFGVDQLWERELAKLQQIEEAERKAAEEERRRIEDKSPRKRKGKAKTDMSASSPQQERAASPPPLLPTVPTTGGKPVPAAQASSSDTESEDEVKLTRARRASVGTLQTLGAKGWFASSDEEDGHGTQRRPRPVQGQRRPETKRMPPARAPAPESDSDDVPLAAQLSRLPGPAGGSDSDSDKPLAALVDKQRPSLPMPPLSFGEPLLPVSKPLLRTTMPNSAATATAADDADDDDVPLGLKQSRSRTSLAKKPDSDDDKPLGLRASRLSQYPTGFGAMHPSMHMMAHQVPMFNPQQLMMQAQMQQSMYSLAAPSLMGPGAYAPALSMPMMPGPPMAPVQAPQDSGTFGFVDRWRRDVSAIGPEGGAAS